jgi:hypothetical protein
MARGGVSCGEIIVDLGATKREVLIALIVQVLTQEDKAIHGKAGCSSQLKRQNEPPCAAR